MSNLIQALKISTFLLFVLLINACSSLDLNDYIHRDIDIEIDNESDVKVGFIVWPTKETWCLLNLYCKTSSNYPYQLRIFFHSDDERYQTFVINQVKLVYPDTTEQLLPEKSTDKAKQGASGWKIGFNVTYDDFLDIAYKYQDVKVSIQGYAQASTLKNKFRLEANIFHVAESRIEAGPRN